MCYPVVLVIPANGHDREVTTNFESLTIPCGVISACVSPESRKEAWIPTFAGMAWSVSKSGIKAGCS